MEKPQRPVAALSLKTLPSIVFSFQFAERQSIIQLTCILHHNTFWNIFPELFWCKKNGEVKILKQQTIWLMLNQFSKYCVLAKKKTICKEAFKNFKKNPPVSGISSLKNGHWLPLVEQYAYFSIMLAELTELLGNLNLMLFALEGISSFLAGLHCVRVEAYYVVSRGSRSRIMPCDAIPQLWENWNRSHEGSWYGEIDVCRLPILKNNT